MCAPLLSTTFLYFCINKNTIAYQQPYIFPFVTHEMREKEKEKKIVISPFVWSYARLRMAKHSKTKRNKKKEKKKKHHVKCAPCHVDYFILSLLARVRSFVRSLVLRTTLSSQTIQISGTQISMHVLVDKYAKASCTHFIALWHVLLVYIVWITQVTRTSDNDNNNNNKSVSLNCKPVHAYYYYYYVFFLSLLFWSI